MNDLVCREVTREKIEALQQTMRTMPQCTTTRTEHYFSGGMYCRKLWRPAGTVIVGKVHKAAHLFICVSGCIIAWTENGMRTLMPGDVIESQPGTKRVTYAVQDSIGMTIHKTDKKELSEIEEELIEPCDDSMFDSDNRLIGDARKAVGDIIESLGE